MGVFGIQDGVSREIFNIRIRLRFWILSIRIRNRFRHLLQVLYLRFIRRTQNKAHLITSLNYKHYLYTFFDLIK